MTALDPALVDALLPIINAAVEANVAAARRNARENTWVPGSVIDVSGPHCNVEPDDNPGFAVPATRMSAGIVKGSRVQVLYAGAGQALAFGPIPQE